MASANAWGKYLTHIPPFTVVKIVIYKKKNGKSKGITRGYNYFVENYIHHVFVQADNEAFYVKANCFKSQKKRDKPHNVEVKLNTSTGTVLHGVCSCAAGYVIFLFCCSQNAQFTHIVL